MSSKLLLAAHRRTWTRCFTTELVVLPHGLASGRCKPPLPSVRGCEWGPTPQGGSLPHTRHASVGASSSSRAGGTPEWLRNFHPGRAWLRMQSIPQDLPTRPREIPVRARVRYCDIPAVDSVAPDPPVPPGPLGGTGRDAAGKGVPGVGQRSTSGGNSVST